MQNLRQQKVGLGVKGAVSYNFGANPRSRDQPLLNLRTPITVKQILNHFYLFTQRYYWIL